MASSPHLHPDESLLLQFAKNLDRKLTEIITAAMLPTRCIFLRAVDLVEKVYRKEFGMVVSCWLETMVVVTASGLPVRYL